MPYEVLEPTVDRLVDTGYVLRDGDHLGLTRAGLRQVNFVSSLILGWVTDKLAQSTSFEGRPDRREVEAALQRIAYRALAQRDWDEDRPQVATPDRN
jgi:hypothetical protein